MTLKNYLYHVQQGAFMSKQTLSLHPDIEIVVGSTLCRRTAFVIDKFLLCQKEIQRFYPSSILVLSTDEPDFASELRDQLVFYKLKGEVITYKTNKPVNNISFIWSITGGREAIRKYAVYRNVPYLLFVDADVLLEPSALIILTDRIRGSDVLWSAYRFPPKGDMRIAGGCFMMNHRIMTKIHFRCFEFGNKELIFEDELFDSDSFRQHARVIKGVFLHVKHYANQNEYVATEPQDLGWVRKLANSTFVRYILVSTSIAIKYNIPGRLHSLLYRVSGSSGKLFI
jgi:hypothetical protein